MVAKKISARQRPFRVLVQDNILDRNPKNLSEDAIVTFVTGPVNGSDKVITVKFLENGNLEIHGHRGLVITPHAGNDLEISFKER